jgi:lipopolysaccharide assembly protein A
MRGPPCFFLGPLQATISCGRSNDRAQSDAEGDDMMGVLRWIFLSVVFVALLFISLQNADPVTLRIFSFYTWQAPLVFVVLIAFAAGVALGLLAAAIKVARLKRQVRQMRRDHRHVVTQPSTHAPAPGTAPAPGPGFEPRSPGY